MTCTVGSRLSEPSDYPYPDIWMSAHVAMFSVPAEKYVAVTGVLLQETTKLLYERLSRTLQHFFHPVQSRECCTTPYYSVAN